MLERPGSAWWTKQDFRFPPSMASQGNSRTHWSKSSLLATSPMTLPCSTMRPTLPETTSSSSPTTWRTILSPPQPGADGVLILHARHPLALE
eukprot:1537568-Pleurochrysis_carterae.AAC.1